MAIRSQRLCGPWQDDGFFHDDQQGSDSECAGSNSDESESVSDQETPESNASDVQDQNSKSFKSLRSETDTHLRRTRYLTQSIAFCIHFLLEACNFFHNVGHMIKIVTAKSCWEELRTFLWCYCRQQSSRTQRKGGKTHSYQVQLQPACDACACSPAAAHTRAGPRPQELAKQAFRTMVAERREISRKWRLEREAESEPRDALANETCESPCACPAERQRAEPRAYAATHPSRPS